MPSIPPLPLLTAAEMQAWDRRAIDDLAVPERVLMESAGRGAARVVQALYPEGRVVAAVGRGNNGGDALVLLRTLRAWGREVAAVPVEGSSLREELLHGWEIPVQDSLGGAAVLIDGILGTGATGAPRPPAAAAVRALNEAGAPIVALDGPTGVDLTRGTVEGDAVRAAVTITFGATKRGLLLHPGRAHAGRILVLETGFPPLEASSAGVLTGGWASTRRVTLPPDAHKGTAGRLVIVSGRKEMGGAAILCGHAALRGGTGLVLIASPAANRVPVQTALPEAIFVDREGGELADVAATASALVVGPAMGTDDAARDALVAVLHAARGPVLLDADALTLVARDAGSLPTPDDRGGRNWLMTPHPGEMARLLGIEVRAVTADPFAAVEAARDRFRCAVLLKGTPTLVAAPGSPTLANVTGHSGVGVGGMGDTLAGLAGAFLARGTPVYDAAGMAIHYAGAAADRVGRGRPILPRDVAEALPDVLSGKVDGGAPRLSGVLLDLAPAQ